MADVARRIYHRRWRCMRELRSAVRTGALILSMTAQSEAAGRWALGSRLQKSGNPHDRAARRGPAARGTRAAPGRQADYISIRAHNLE